MARTRLDFIERRNSGRNMVETDRARLVVLCINGDWRPPRPRIRQLELTFSPTEIRDNWNMLVRHPCQRGWLK
jgi:hypothetical protein